MANSKEGRFVWYDLMTTDPAAAIRFYSDVIGWTTQAWEDSGYTMWAASQGPLGGVAALPEAAQKSGTPPHWMAHVQVADVDATVARAQQLDAKIRVPPTDIPRIGRFAILADPQGASLAVFHPTGDMALHDSNRPGEFSWNELLTTDSEAAFRFYRELFGWERLLDHDMGPMGNYLIYGKSGVQLGGMFNKPKNMPAPTSWNYYVEITDLDAAVGRARAAGATVLNGPMPVPGGARIVQLTDPQGAFFALHEAAK